MPVLHHYQNRDGAYVKEWIQGSLPVCEGTGSFEDLHLVVHGDGAHAQLLGADARRLAQDASLSIPLNVVAAKDLDRLVASGKLPESAPCVAHLGAFFSRERAGRWETLTGRCQQQAQLDLEGEFRLH